MSLQNRLSNQHASPNESPDSKTNLIPQELRQATKYLSPKTKEYIGLRDVLHLMLIERINSSDEWTDLSDDDQRNSIKKFIETKLAVDFKDTPLNKQEKESLINEIIQEAKGFGPLDPLLKDPTVSDILVNGCRKIFVERYGKLELTGVEFKNDVHLMNIIERIVSKVGRRIDEKSPMVDARLPDGSRVNAIIPPLAIDGPSLSIRKFKADAASIDNLLGWGAMTVGMAETLKAAVKARLNIVISGGTGAGKTTLLNSLSALIPEDERIVTIEDSAELSLQQIHVVRLETRPANIEGEGRITARDLVINSLRMRPDRVVIGECRGAEALDMLQAMNTGHDGSLTTLHANTPRDALSRLETMVMFSGVELPERTIRTQISSAVHLIVQASRLTDGSRRITHITEVTGMEGMIITMQDLFIWDQEGYDEEDKVIGCHLATGVRPSFAEKCRRKGIPLPLDIFDPKNPPIYLCSKPPNMKSKNNPFSKAQKQKLQEFTDNNLNQINIQGDNALLKSANKDSSLSTRLQR